MALSTCIARSIVGVFLSASVVMGQNLPAQDARQGDDQNQSVFLRLTSRDDAELVAEFRRRLTEYDDVRRRLDASLPRPVVSEDVATILRVTAAHQAALRTARASARQGDIFFTRVAERFRAWIRDALHGVPPQVFIAMITEEDAPPTVRPCVNDSYPNGGAVTTMPPDLLQLLPALPAGLEYRFIDRDLILWDPHANLIVDVIPNALARSGQS